MAQEQENSALREARRVVVKVGSSLVTNDGRGLDEAAIGEWCRQMAVLVHQGREVIMVSSGAIAEGMKRLGWAKRRARNRPRHQSCRWATNWIPPPVTWRQRPHPP